MESFNDAGVVGIFALFALMLVRTVLDYKEKAAKTERETELAVMIVAAFKDLNEKVGKIKERQTEVLIKTRDLWDWHNVSDQEGVKVWYVRRSLEEAVKSLALTIGNLGDVLKEMSHGQRTIVEHLDRIDKKLEEK